MVKIHSSEAFYALDDPLEAAIFSVLIELLKDRDKERNVDVDLLIRTTEDLWSFGIDR